MRPAGGRRALHVAVAPRKAGPATVLWWWRYELAAVAALAVLAVAVGAAWTLGGLGVVTGAVAAVPAARRRAVRRAWGVVTPHRLRAAFREVGLHSTVTGRLPTVVWCSPRAWGERVVLWPPPGLVAADLAEQRARLASTCWADEVAIEPHPTRRQLLVVGVHRRRRTDD